MATILLIDDEPDVLDSTKFALELKGYKVITASSGEEALKSFQASRPDLLIIDYKLPGMSGTQLLKAVRELDGQVSAIMITGLAQRVEEVQAECQRLGASGFFSKPLPMDQVFQAIEKAIKK